MKKRIFSVLLCIAVLFCGCTQNKIIDEPTTAEVPQPETTNVPETTALSGELISLTDRVPAKRDDVVDNATSIADWASHYKSPKDMLNDGRIDVVVEGTIISSEFVNASDENFYPDDINCTTKSILKVNHAYKGSIRVDDEICIVEQGGFVPMKFLHDWEYKEKGEEPPEYTGSGGVKDYRINDYKVCETGEHVILFLSEMPWKDDASQNRFYVERGESVYTVANGVQGKYLLTPGRVLIQGTKRISTDGYYLPYILKDMLPYDSVVFTVDSFGQFVEDNLEIINK